MNEYLAAELEFEFNADKYRLLTRRNYYLISREYWTEKSFKNMSTDYFRVINHWRDK